MIGKKESCIHIHRFVFPSTLVVYQTGTAVLLSKSLSHLMKALYIVLICIAICRVTVLMVRMTSQIY